ncbi:hypothetical protein LTR53_008898 [Teratosphaeriaceae sp. CCFEE 6253]|nr:hypothetical protein LTR53_008898 [Teratosphaeriaceae sp. CCFEE 6253]
MSHQPCAAYALRPRPVKKRSYRAAEKTKAQPKPKKHVHFGDATVVGYSAETKDKTKERAATARPAASSRQPSYNGRPAASRQSSATTGRPAASTRQSTYSGRPATRYWYESQDGRAAVTVGK